MGKATKEKQRKAEEISASFQKSFVENSKLAAQVAPDEPIVNEFSGYESQFTRDPMLFVPRTRSRSRPKRVLEMARFLFGLYRVPHVLEKVWSEYVIDKSDRDYRHELARRRPYANPAQRAPSFNPNTRTTNFRDWYVCVATGGSLYKKHTRNTLTKKETHLFLSAPQDIDLCQSVIFAVASATGASRGDAHRLAKSKISEKPFGEFWFECVRFFCLKDHMPQSIAQINDLVDFAATQKTENANYRLLGSSQSLVALLRRMEEWHRALARTKDLSGLEWAGVDIHDYKLEQKDKDEQNPPVIWNFHQITSGKELAQEGAAMRHCVLGYKTSCARGDCSIWSLTKTDAFGVPQRRLTMKDIGHIRPLVNRCAGKFEKLDGAECSEVFFSHE